MISGATDVALDAGRHVTMILAGDLGGTKILLEGGVLQHGYWEAAFSKRYSATDYPDLASVLRAFLHEWEAHRRPPAKIARACFGVAGRVFDNRVQMTNLPWRIDGDAIST